MRFSLIGVLIFLPLNMMSLFLEQKVFKNNALEWSFIKDASNHSFSLKIITLWLHQFPFWTLKFPYLSPTQSFTMFQQISEERKQSLEVSWLETIPDGLGGEEKQKRQCHIFAEFYPSPSYISAEEKSYTKQRQCMSSRACHLCDFDLKTHQPTDFFDEIFTRTKTTYIHSDVRNTLLRCSHLQSSSNFPAHLNWMIQSEFFTGYWRRYFN